MHAAQPTSRRDFLGQCLKGTAILGAGTSYLSLAQPIKLSARSRVIVARDPLLRGSGSSVNESRMEALLDRAIQALLGRRGETAREAWRKVAGPGDRVGLKVNTLGGRGISTNLQLAAAVCTRLQQAGVKAGNIVVWDRDSEEMERAGFRLAVGGSGVQCFGTDRTGYEEELSVWGSAGSRVSKILTRFTTVLINLPVLKDHDGAGVTIALKNMYGAIHNPNKYHPNGCDPYIADVNMLPEIRSRMRLTICDATTAMYEGGPGYKPEHSWQMNGVLVSEDPVALDATGWQMIERKRAEKALKTLAAEERAPHYIITAADSKHRLGHCDTDHIEVVEV